MKTLVRGRGVVDGTGREFERGKALLIKGDRIVAVEQELVGRAEKVLEFEDAVLLLGFVDAHTHITIRPGEGDQHGQLRAPPVRQALRGVENMRKVVRSGVTTIRVIGEKASIDLEFRRAVDQGELLGPRMRVAGKALSATHGHGAALGCADGPEALRQAVRENARDGADHAKIFVTGGVSNSDGPSTPTTTLEKTSGPSCRKRIVRASR